MFVSQSHIHSRSTMIKWTCFGVLLGLCVQLQTAQAREFRIYTSIALKPSGSEQNGKMTEAKVIGRSLTFFHAGRFYDYTDEAGDLVIFEPALKQFTIINGDRMKATVVKFPELIQFLRVAETKTKRQLNKLKERSDERSQKTARFLQFQLAPEYNTKYNPVKKELQLNSSQISYRVKCVQPKYKELADAYLNYTDWTARMNYILYPGSSLPQSRLKMNQHLREKKLFPVSVELQSHVRNPFQLKATHNVRWELDRTDRTRINDWERLRHNEQLKYISFQDYRRALLAAQ